ncbi:MAG: hypothetical protein H0S80_05665 [Desulfovibrionaceae bacterium]|nr:hypothetical protein [Desulfovibrionaceae bacterium]
MPFSINRANAASISGIFAMWEDRFDMAIHARGYVGLSVFQLQQTS